MLALIDAGHDTKADGTGLAERLAQDRPVHRLVAEDAGRGLGQVAVAEQRHRAEIGADRALLELGGEAQHVGLRLQLATGKSYFAFAATGLPPSFSTSCEQLACSLW